MHSNSSSFSSAAGAAGSTVLDQQQAKCQVKVMRLALTNPAESSISASASRGNLLQLPKVFEVIHAGQTIKCLARIMYAPQNAKAVAKLFPPASSNLPPFELGTGSGSGQIDLIMQGRLQYPGAHELVLSCTSREHGEVLRKVFRIEVAPSLAYLAPPLVQPLPKQEYLVRFQVKNFSQSLVACFRTLEFVREAGVMVVKEYMDLCQPVFLSPQETYSVMFRIRVLGKVRCLGRLLVQFTAGLGEHCELFFPKVFVNDDDVANNSVTRMAKVGEPIKGLPQDDAFLLHGSLECMEDSFLIPTKPGVFTTSNVVVTMGEEFDLRPKQSVVDMDRTILSDD